MAKIECYEAKDGWRWRVVARNGKIIAESGEAYKKQMSPLDVAKRLHSAAADVYRFETGHSICSHTVNGGLVK